MKLLSCLVNSVPICTVYNEDKPLSPRVVVSPQRPNLILATYILEGIRWCTVNRKLCHSIDRVEVFKGIPYQSQFWRHIWQCLEVLRRRLLVRIYPNFKLNSHTGVKNLRRYSFTGLTQTLNSTLWKLWGITLLGSYPNIKLDILIGDSFNVEPDSWNGRHWLT